MKTFYVTREPDLLGAAVALAVALAAACGGSPTRPTPTPPPRPDAPTVACQADVALQSFDGQPVTYTVTPPTAQGGATPVAVACDAPETFPVGTTKVTCTATDSLQQTGTCSFTIAVTVPPKLTKTKFLAFGDSLTYGVVSDPVTLRLMGTPDSYPSQLQGLFLQRYPTQTIFVENAGIPGEVATTDGQFRLTQEIYAKRPEVVLLMEGTNDLNGYSPNTVARTLDDMTRDSFQRGVIVFLATLPPARPGRRPLQAVQIPILNELIKGIASKYQANNVHLVDVYAPLAADMSLIGKDDLHPTVQGYQVMAKTWFDAIAAALEEKPSTTQPVRRR